MQKIKYKKNQKLKYYNIRILLKCMKNINMKIKYKKILKNKDSKYLFVLTI